jgi:hypothetical protein
MPELPEVETSVRALRPLRLGRTITNVRNTWPRHVITPSLAEWEDLKALTEAHGVPGYETEVRALLRDYMEPLGTLSQDKLGSVICHQGDSGPKVSVHLFTGFDAQLFNSFPGYNQVFSLKGGNNCVHQATRWSRVSCSLPSCST